MPFEIIETPVISVQCDWNETLRIPKGEAWVSCKFRGQKSFHGKIVSEGISGGAPIVSASNEFEVNGVSKGTMKVKHKPSESSCTFIAPQSLFTGVHNKSVVSIGVTLNGLCVSACTDNKLQVWDAETGIVRRSLEGHVGNIYKCRFFPSGVVVLSGGADMRLKIWSAETGQCPVTLSGHTAAITDFCIVDKGRNIISVSKDGTAKLWDCGMSSCLGDLIKLETAINSCCLFTNSNNIEIGEREHEISEREIGTEDKLLIVGCEDGSAHVIAVWSRKVLHALNFPSAVNCVVSLSNNCLVGCQDGQILLFKIGKIISQPILSWHESNSAVLSLLAYKEMGFFAGKADGTCTFYPLNGTEKKRIQLTGPDCDPVYDIAFAGNSVFTASRDAVIRKYDVAKILEATM